MGINSTIILGGLIIYIIIAFYIGYRGYKDTKLTLDDYFLAGRGVGVILLAFTMYATYQSAYMYIGCTGFTYSHGIGIWYSNIANLLWSFLFLIVGIPMWKLGRKFNYISQGDFFAHRFDSDILRYAVSAWMILGLTPYIGSQVNSVAITLEVLSEGAIPFALGAILFIGTVTIYASIGGMKGVIWTDLIQGILMLVAIWFGIFYILPQVGGIRGLFVGIAEQVPEALGLPGPDGLLTPGAWFGYMICDALGGVMWIQNWLRFYIGKSWKTLAAIAFIVPIGTTLTFLPAMIYGLSGRILIPGLEQADAVMPQLLINFMPVGVSVLFVIGLFAASMSTIDSLSLGLATSLSRDFVQKARPKMDEAKLVSSGRIFVAIFLVVGAVVGYFASGSYLIVLLTLLSLSLSSLLFPIAIAGIYWKRATREGALAGLIVGSIVGIRLLLFGPEFDPYFGMYGGVWALLATTVTLIVVSLLTKPTNQEVIDEIGKAMSNPLNE